MFFVGTNGGNGKVFDFPVFEPNEPQDSYEYVQDQTLGHGSYDRWGGNGYSSPVDPMLGETDVFSSSLSSTSLSPVKPMKGFEETELATTFSSISLDDGIFVGAGHSRLPVFDKLNSLSATFLEGKEGGSP